MESNIKLDIVRNYISSEIADTMKKIETEKVKNDIEIKNEMEKKLEELLEKRDRIYNGDIKLIEEIYNNLEKK